MYQLFMTVIITAQQISATNAKLITITVEMPNKETVSFASYRGNY